jgi:hypothetical protein
MAEETYVETIAKGPTRVRRASWGAIFSGVFVIIVIQALYWARQRFCPGRAFAPTGLGPEYRDWVSDLARRDKLNLDVGRRPVWPGGSPAGHAEPMGCCTGLLLGVCRP